VNSTSTNIIFDDGYFESDQPMRGTRISGLLNFLRREAKEGENISVGDNSAEKSQSGSCNARSTDKYF